MGLYRGYFAISNEYSVIIYEYFVISNEYNSWPHDACVAVGIFGLHLLNFEFNNSPPHHSVPSTSSPHQI